ncbi:MAG: ABC transporter permease subunit [Verrucomicrobiales bacterium]
MSENFTLPAGRPPEEDARSLARFQVARGTLLLDRFMTFAIHGGGLAVIIAVFGILVFILAKTIPLFRGAQVKESATLSTGSGPKPAGTILGTDEWARLPYIYGGGRSLTFARLSPDGSSTTPESVPLPIPEDFQTSVAKPDPKNGRILLGSFDGRVTAVSLNYKSQYGGDGSSTITAAPAAGPVFGDAAGPVKSLSAATSATAEVFACIREKAEGRLSVEIFPATRKAGLLGKGKLEVGAPISLDSMIEGTPHGVLVSSNAQGVLVETVEGIVYYFVLAGGKAELRQKFDPFAGDDSGIATMDFLLGDVSLVLTDTKGQVKVFSLLIPEGENIRVFRETRSFPNMATAPSQFMAGGRGKNFLLVAGREAMLGYSTTTSTRWRETLPYEPIAVTLDPKTEVAFLLDDTGGLHRLDIHDPHPQAGWNAFFGRIWYEGYSGPRHEWQSSGASDDFEPKLSMVPLLIGSLKGTFYAMIFAVPIALLAAVYTAQVLHPKVKRIVKPTMEIMASLPSVVLGFLAALWLAPLIENKIPSLLGAVAGIPLAVILAGYAWSMLPYPVRRRIPAGREFLWMLPLVVLGAWIGWSLGPAIERTFFTVVMPDGKEAADFRLWWRWKSGTSFETRNCVVVGFMMGFAVIPIIFTIAEDALSNVPPSLTAASQALGASRWQVIRTVVLPVAAAGIFSALMVGFGRAVGETMIMVMATGNTPVMDPDGNLLFRDFFHNIRQWASGQPDSMPVATHWQPFNGMRTLSANLAVELPEAPENSTHYRALFFGALLLFIMTFVLNTVAELLRQRLREKFKIS